MYKLWQVAREELSFNLKQWSFYISFFLMAGVFVGAGALPRLQDVADETPLADVETVFTVEELLTVPTGVVDDAGILRYIPPEQAENLFFFDEEATAHNALEAGEIESYYVIGEDYLDAGNISQFSLQSQLIVSTDDAIRKLLDDNILRTLDDPNLIARVQNPVNLTTNGPPLPTYDFIPTDLSLDKLAAAGLVTVLFTFLLNASGSLLLRALQREVEAGVLEVVISSTTPAQLIGGKLLGLTILVLGQSSFTLLAGWSVYGQNPDGSGPASLPLSILLLMIPYIIFGYLAYSGVLLSVASLWPTLSESYQLQFVIRLVAISPLLGIIFILPNVNGIIAVVLTMLPFFAPLLMPFRALLTDVPAWQFALSISLSGLWAVFLLWLSTRLFRAQGLLTGRTPLFKALVTALSGG